jgi:hypothetical protein
VVLTPLLFEQAIDDAAEHYVHLLVVQRLRTAADREAAAAAFQRAWGRPLAPFSRPSVAVVQCRADVGRAKLRRAFPLELPPNDPAGGLAFTVIG